MKPTFTPTSVLPQAVSQAASQVVDMASHALHDKGKHHHAQQDAQVTVTGKNNFLSKVRTPKARTTGTRSGGSAKKASKSLSQRLRKKSKRQRAESEEFDEAIEELLHHIAAEGDGEDMGDERHGGDAEEQYMLVLEAQSFLDAVQLPDEKERKELPDGDLRKTLTPEKRQELKKLLASRKAALEEKRAAKAGGKVEQGKSAEAEAAGQKTDLHTLFAMLDAAGVAPQLLKKLHDLPQVSSLALGNACCQTASDSDGFHELLTGLLKGIGGVMRQPTEAGRQKKAPPTLAATKFAFALHGLQSSYRIAQDLRSDLSNTLSRPSRDHAGQLAVALLQTAESARREPDELLSAVGDVEAMPPSLQRKVCGNLLAAVRAMPTAWWSAERAMGDLIDSLRSRANESHTDNWGERKKAMNMEQALRTLIKA